MTTVSFRIITLLFLISMISTAFCAPDQGKPFTLTTKSIGPINKSTPYNFNVIRKLFSPLLVKKETYYTEDMASDMMVVYKNHAPLLTIIQGLRNDVTKVILCVSFLSNDIKNQLGAQIGARFDDIYKKDSPRECIEGREEMSSAVICRAPNTKNIHYVFSGERKPSDDVTSFNVLKNWKLVQITWLPGDDFSLQIHQYCRAEDVLKVMR